MRQIAAFADVPDAVLSNLINLCPALEFGVGERLMSQSQRSDFAMIILSGEVTATNESDHGAVPLAHLAAPTLVGQVGALSHGFRTASVVARTPVRALKVDRQTLLDACQGAPEILTSVFAELGRQIEAVNRALGLYAGGLAALQRGELDASLLADLNNPSPGMRTFADAFRGLALQIARERRQRDEMASAALIQRAMLPGDLASLPLHGRCSAYGDMRAARDVGGDFYDVFVLGSDRLVLTIGDVCGKGVPAALFMSQTMTTLRMAAPAQRSVSGILEAANTMLCAYNPSLMFATLFCGVLDLDSGRFEYANCGHCPPIVLRRSGALERLSVGGTALGLAQGKRIGSSETLLRPGEGVFLYTDGVTESLDPAGEEFGEARLLASLRQTEADGPEMLVRRVMDTVARFTDGADPFDDITCLAALRLAKRD